MKGAFALDAEPPSLAEFDDLVEGNEAAFIIEVDGANLKSDLSNLRASISLSLKSDSLGPGPDSEKLNLAFIHAYAYFSCDSSTYTSLLQCSAIPALVNQNNYSLDNITSFSNSSSASLGSILPNLPDSFHSQASIPNDTTVPIPIFAAAKKRYKPMHRRVQPVPTTLPENFRILRHFPTDPLENLPTLNPNPPAFTPTGRYTQDRMEIIDKLHDHDSFGRRR
ncbi:hypothetical protein BT96DRAFT_842476 [Gymnopus androsaceus JB14]|uniref:Uncharacterized protein n=1 Tax=Gymnopus androsaceus JB14 TaxID=1447944 RepID=A0A6A4GFY0_9AGAR|nr:hypothetical protein BT96DRAFT_842476 [Gymnopus androsaceus JB14]